MAPNLPSEGKVGGWAPKLGATKLYSIISGGEKGLGMGMPGLGPERRSVEPASARLRILKDISQFFQEVEFRPIICHFRSYYVIFSKSLPFSVAFTFPFQKMRKLGCSSSLWFQNSRSGVISLLTDVKPCIELLYFRHSWDGCGDLLWWLVWGQLFIFQGNVWRALQFSFEEVMASCHMGHNTWGSSAPLLWFSAGWLIDLQRFWSQLGAWEAGRAAIGDRKTQGWPLSYCDCTVEDTQKALNSVHWKWQPNIFVQIK